MNTSVLYATMFGSGLLMASLPFVVFFALGKLLDLPSTDVRLVAAFVILALVLAYGISLLSFSLIQKDNCDEIKNFKQIALNSLLTVGIYAVMFVILYFVPWFRNVVRDLFPPDMDTGVKDATAYAYYAFWSMLFGVAIGGTLSASCSKQTTDVMGAVQQEIRAAKASANAEANLQEFASTDAVKADLPDEGL